MSGMRGPWAVIMFGVVDGAQTAGDCALIKKFQARYGISPAAGRAGPTIADVARRLAASADADADEQARCRVRGTGLTICANLLPADAVALWHVASIGATVKVFGQRPGT